MGVKPNVKHITQNGVLGGISSSLVGFALLTISHVVEDTTYRHIGWIIIGVSTTTTLTIIVWSLIYTQSHRADQDGVTHVINTINGTYRPPLHDDGSHDAR